VALGAFGLFVISIYYNKGTSGGGFIDPTFDNIFNIDKKIITADKLHYSSNHYIIVSRSESAAEYELLGHSINPYFGNAGQDHIVVKDKSLIDIDSLTPYHVINRPIIKSHLMEIIDKSYRNYVIPDDSIWYSHLNYYFLGQITDPQPPEIDMDGLLIKNFEYDFEHGFREIDPHGISDYLVERRTSQLSKVNPSLLNSPRNVFNHFNLLFISKLQNLLNLAKEGNVERARVLLINAERLIDAFKHHSYWNNFNDTESKITKQSNILKQEFPELSDTEIQRFVRYYFLVDKNTDMLKKRLLIQVMSKSIDMVKLFDEFMTSDFRVDIFPIFKRADFYKACERLVEGIQFDLNTISRESIRDFLIKTGEKLTMKNIRDEILKDDTYKDAKTITDVNINNFKDIKAYCLIWGNSAHNNIKQLCSNEHMSVLKREEEEIRNRELSEIRIHAEKKNEEEERIEREELRNLPNLIEKNKKKKIYDLDIEDFEDVSDEDIINTIKYYTSEEYEIQEKLDKIKHILGWLKHYRERLEQLQKKYQ
jgi:hypothetical protein